MQLKYRSFIGDIVIPNPQTPQIDTASLQTQEPQKIKHILIGSHQSVTTTMQVLQKFGYADIQDWSPLLATENQGEFMSVLIKAIAS